MIILITGSKGFIGRNLMLRLGEVGHRDILEIEADSSKEALQEAVHKADVVFHLAGVNRPTDPAEFATGNAGFTGQLCEALAATGRSIPVIFSSSIQAALDNPYGLSKRQAEGVLHDYASTTGASVHLFRLANVFGKWSRPNYNSAVATFCHNVARALPITIHDPSAPLRLVYIDDVIDAFLRLLSSPPPSSGFLEAGPVFETTVGEVAGLIRSFPKNRISLAAPQAGSGLVRALYATYLSHLPPEHFDYQVPRHVDLRGEFAEMLKTHDCGQFSYFTAHPGITRGDHYHHTKTEKFLVVRGTARFEFRHMDTGQIHTLTVPGGEGRIVETVPGWTHNIANIGQDELIVMLWANEAFDRARPDTIPMKVIP
ncbi:NAD-dependent epimerase/dehydratase family protein [Geothrix sp. 21YS21S-4]|uniref:UDP-2-acetamido-2,6-beta-L-arabino-hexul-4-ose reductase n=1 Tax=Geothrix sp. 21YS21S-4 TaxID=3068889 RepID=UPI0027BA01FA|nr:NAD-dependent epimerase/dehydratase family protein [Geothrix sp. 21YS21S-4]